MPIDPLRRVLQLQTPSLAPQLPASVAVGLALPAATLGIVLIGMDLHFLGMLAWTIAVATIAFALRGLYALLFTAALALGGVLLWRLMLGGAVLLTVAEQMSLLLLTVLAALVGRLTAREFAQRARLAAANAQLDVLTTTLHSVFETSRDCIKLLGTDGSVLSINTPGLALLGADGPAQVVGKSWFALWGAEQQDLLADVWHEVLTRGAGQFEGGARILTGERRVWRNVFTLVRSTNGQARVICVSSDVTDSVNSQQAHDSRVAQLGGLLDQVKDAAFALDANWIVRFASPSGEAFSERLGRISAVGRSIWEILPLRQGEPAAILVRRALDGQGLQRGEHFFVEHQLWVSIAAFPSAGGVSILVRDITAQKQAEKVAAEETARLTVAQEIAGFGDWGFDYDQGAMSFSPRAVAILGLEGCAPHEHKKCLLEKLDARERMALVQAIVNCTEAAPTIDLTVRLPAADGSEKHLHWIGRLLTDAHGNAARMLGAIQDISEHLHAQQEIDRARRFVRDLVDVLPQQIVVIDQLGRYVITNQTWESERRSYYGSNIVSANFFDMKGRTPDDYAIADAAHQAARDILSGASTRFEYEYEANFEGEQHQILLQGLPLHSGDSRLAVFVYNDITWARRWMISILSKDDLTGLPNRKALLAKLAECAAQQPPFALLLLNLDRFKNINDTLGYDCGDELLQLAAGRLRAALPDSAYLARTGADEFAIILDFAQCQSVIDATLSCFTETFPLAGEANFVTASIGVSACPKDSRNVDDLMKFAGFALLRAKAAGRNNSQWFRETMLLPSRERLALENELHTAARQHEFELFYQGKFELESGRLMGAEALLRWRSPKRGLVSPADFIPLLEETGLIIAVGEWILADACQQARRWYEHSGEWLPIAVNVSVLQIASRSFAEKAIAILRESNLPPFTIELEITESALMTDVAYGAKLIQNLKAAGFSIALDDFGTGYSSLGYLRKFQPNVLKIDRSFVADLTAESNDREIVGGIIQLAKALNIYVIAEGVELAEQRNILCKLGCVYGQGYLFGRPLPAQQFQAGVIAAAHPGASVRAVT